MRLTSNKYDPFSRGETIKLNEELVESLLDVVLVLGRTLASYSVQLIDENDGGSGLTGGGEELSDTTSSDSDVHLVKLGSRSGEEVDSGLSGDSTGEEGLSGTRRAYSRSSSVGASVLEMARNSPVNKTPRGSLPPSFSNLVGSLTVLRVSTIHEGERKRDLRNSTTS
jgi:hypothetical protein